MAVVLHITSMQMDLKSFGRAAREFIKNHQRLSELESQLSYAAAEAKHGNRELQWSTDFGEGGPIRTVPSSDYRSQGGGKRIVAELSFKYSGKLDAKDDNRFVIASGGTRVRLSWDGSDGEVIYHFDIHPDGEGHPMLHIQFNGAVAEVPRLHSIFAHPLDILEFTLMEVFQKKWREAWANSKFASEFRKFPANQRKRMIALLSGYRDLLESSDPALVALLMAPGVPVDLYPA